jgi:hypothetical protein
MSQAIRKYISIDQSVAAERQQTAYRRANNVILVAESETRKARFQVTRPYRGNVSARFGS